MACSVQARETGAHSGCSQSIPPLWGGSYKLGWEACGASKSRKAVCWSLASPASSNPSSAWAWGGRRAGWLPCLGAQSEACLGERVWTPIRPKWPVRRRSVPSPPPLCPHSPAVPVSSLSPKSLTPKHSRPLTLPVLPCRHQLSLGTVGR